MLLLALIAPLAAQAQEELTVYEGTTTNSYVPAYMGYFDDFSRSQFVIPAEDLDEMNGGTISSIKFYTTNSNVPYTSVSTVDVYLLEVDYTSISAFEPKTNDAIVYQGTLNIVTEGDGGSLTIEFSTPYTYNGGNLLVAIENTTDAGYTFIYFYGQVVTGASGAGYNSSSLSGVTFTQRNFIPKTTFTYEPAQSGGDVCEKPATLVAENVTGNSATLNWTGGSGVYNIELNGTIIEENYEGYTYNLTGLAATTAYTAKVQSVCDGSTPTSGWKSVSFTTPCASYDIPYTYGFEDAAPFGCWTVISGNITRYSGTTNTGSYRLDFRGTTSNMIALPQFNETTNNLRVEFYTRPESTGGSSGKFAIGYMTDITDASTFVAVDTYNSTQMTTTYVKKTVDMVNVPANANIAMRQFDCATNYYWYVDDVTVKEVPSCLAPTGLAATVTAHEAELSWTANSGETAWTLYWKESGATDYTEVANATNPYTLNGLTAATNYEFYVVANCSAEEASEASEPFTFATACDVNTIDATHQWSEGFESYNQGTSTSSGVAVTEIQCWERVSVNSSTNSPFVYRNYQSAASTGLASLELKTGTSAVMVALPEFSQPIQNLNVAFNYNCTATSYTYTAELGYITNVADATTFVKLFDIPTPVTRGNHSTFSKDLYEAAAAANAPQGSRVAIRFASSSTYSYPSWNFDDFVVSYVSDCHKPAGLAITDGSITAHGATATWNGTNDSYTIMYGEVVEQVTTYDFEDQTISAIFTNSETHAWTVTSNDKHAGTYSIKSGGAGTAYATSDLTLTLTLTDNSPISFWYKASSEDGYDYGRFFIDGSKKLETSGTTNSWAQYTDELTAGTHTLIWRYYKDSGTDSGDDCFYVDDITITSGAVETWTTLPNIAASSYTFENLTPNRTYQVKVKGVCGDEETAETAPVSFTTLESCPAPTGLAIAEGYPTAHGVSFTWEYEDDEVFQFALPVGNVTDPSAVNFNTTWYAGEDFPMWNTLSADTDWSFWLRKKCGDSEYSDPVSISFHTPEACPAPTNFDVDDITNHTATLSWEGDHEGYKLWYRTAAYFDGIVEEFDSNPSSWTFTQGALNADGTAILSGSSSWNSTSTNNVFDKHMYMNMYGNKNYWLITPSMTINNDAILSFDMAYTAYSGTHATPALNCTTHRFVVLISTDDMQHWTILREWNNAGTGTDVLDQVSQTGENVTISLANFAGQTVYIAFFGHSETSDYDNNFHFDNVAIGTPIAAGEYWIDPNQPNLIEAKTYTIEGLAAETRYEAEIRGYCGIVDGYSESTDIITFTTDIACPAPTALTHANVKSNQADLSWTNGGAENWVVAYKKTADENFTKKNVTTADVTIDGNKVTYTLTGLDETTEYTVKVADNCEASIPGDGQSEWTNLVNFTTMAACSVGNVTVSNIGHYTADVSWNGESADGFTVKYRTAEQVDGIEEGFSIASTTPDGWESKDGLLSSVMGGTALTTGSQWYIGTGNGVFDSHARINIYGSGSSERHGWLITPAINVGIDCVFTFDLALTAYSGTNVPSPATDGTDDRFIVLISTDNEATWTILREWNNSGSDYVYNNIANTAIGEKVSIDLSTYTGQSVRIAFYGESTERNADNNLHIDNVVIGTLVPVGTEQSLLVSDSPANLEDLEAGKKYDVKVIPDCDESSASEWVSFTTVSPNDKWFVTEGNWGKASNWEPTGVPTIDQNVTLLANATIESGCVAKAKSIAGTGTSADAKTLTIKDGGKLKYLNSDIIVRATVEKEIRPYSPNYDVVTHNNGDYYLITNPLSSEVTPSEANGFLVGDYDLYSWNYNATDGNEWRNYKANEFSNLMYGAYGYLYANKNGTTLTYTGDIYPYISYKSRYAEVASSPEDYDFPGWYLYGNPYMYDAYLATAGTNGTALPYIKMNTTGDGFENMPAGTPIEPMEGFFYQATTSASVYVVTTAPAVQSGSKLNMNLRRNNKQLDNAILVFGGDQKLGKMTFRANSSKIFMPVEGKDYAITSVEGQVGEVPVSFKAENNGTYSLSFTSEEVTFSYLHLIDNMTGADVNLLQTPIYTFDARTSDYESRFRLVFATGSSTGSDTFGFVNASGNFCIFGIEGEATVQVIDVLGHVLSSEQFSGSYERHLNVAPGVYMIRLIQGNDVKVQKVVVR